MPIRTGIANEEKERKMARNAPVDSVRHATRVDPPGLPRTQRAVRWPTADQAGVPGRGGTRALADSDRWQHGGRRGRWSKGSAGSGNTSRPAGRRIAAAFLNSRAYGTLEALRGPLCRQHPTARQLTLKG